MPLIPEQDIEIEARGMCFKAKVWGNPEDPKVLALHGWLDNAASFDFLLPKLDGFNVVCVDLAGHGLTGHRPGAGPYNIWQDVPDVFAIADALGWSEFSLLGHSRGSIIATLAAGTFPERIEQLVLIEGLWPQPVDELKAADQLARSISSVNLRTAKLPPAYDSMDDAVTARLMGRFPVSVEAARALVERGIVHTPRGYIWRADPRLLTSSEVKLTELQLASFLNRITAKTTLLLAEEGMAWQQPKFRKAIKLWPKIHYHVLSGNHHLHMSPSPELIELSQHALSDQKHA